MRTAFEVPCSGNIARPRVALPRAFDVAAFCNRLNSKLGVATCYKQTPAACALINTTLQPMGSYTLLVAALVVCHCLGLRQLTGRGRWPRRLGQTTLLPEAAWLGLVWGAPQRECTSRNRKLGPTRKFKGPKNRPHLAYSLGVNNCPLSALPTTRRYSRYASTWPGVHPKGKGYGITNACEPIHMDDKESEMMEYALLWPSLVIIKSSREVMVAESAHTPRVSRLVRPRVSHVAFRRSGGG